MPPSRTEDRLASIVATGGLPTRRALARWVSATIVASSVVTIAILPTIARTQETEDPFLAATTSDPLELARVVDRAGDDAVLARLVTGTPAAAQLAAVRAAPGMRGPERALEALATIARGRDPDLAPAAARAMLEIARALDPQALDAREVMREELSPARAAIAELALDETARADLRRVAEIVLAVLDAAGVPAPDA